MGAPSVFTTASLRTVDGVVVGPAWADHLGRELLRYLRSQKPVAPDCPEEDEQDTDVAVAARIFHEVLSLHPAAAQWPVFAERSGRSSLFKAAVSHVHDFEDAVVLGRLSDGGALLASNIARWLLSLPQQTSATMVFVSPPSASRTASRTAFPVQRQLRSRYATREAAAAIA